MKFSIVPVPLAMIVSSIKEVDMSKPAKDDELGKVLADVAGSLKELVEEKPAKKPKKKAVFEPGTSDESQEEASSSDENEVPDIELWDDLEDR